MTASASTPRPGAEAGSMLRADLAELVALYYRLVPAEELSTTDPGQLVAAVRSHLALAADRAPGRALVRLLDPTVGEDGPSSRDTVVQITTDDMPYLVDSVVAELARIDVSVRRLVHPIVFVRRDLTGTLREVLTGCDPNEAPADALAESWMQVSVDRITDPERARQVEQRLLAVLTDVREVVEDTQRMTGTACALADELDTAPPLLPTQEVADGAALLRWLADGHFTFLGYRRYELVWESIERQAPALRAVLASGLGVLRRDSLAARGFSTGPDVDPLARDLLVLTQASARSTVYRPVYPYYVGVKTFDDRGEVTGEHRFLGVLATTALHEDVLDIPVIGRRVRDVIHRAGVPLQSYSGQRMLEVLQTYPRAELFSTDPNSLYQTVTGVLSLAQRRTLRLFCRRDPYGRFFSCLVYLPRDRYTTTARLAMQDVLMRDLHGTGLEYSAQIGESVHARVHFTVHTDPDDSGVSGAPDVGAITERLEYAVLTWDDRLLDAARAAAPGAALVSGAATVELAQRYLATLPQAYKEDFDAAAALADICRLEALPAPDGMDLCFDALDAAEPSERRFTLYLAGQRITLSQVLPVLQQMDVEVVDERPYQVTRGDGVHCWIYNFGLRLDAIVLEQLTGQDVEDVQRRFCDAFVAAWRGACEVDRFNALVLRAGLDWRQAAVLRGYVRYLRQGRSPYSQHYVEDVLVSHSGIAAALVALFELRFDPALDPTTRDIGHDRLATQITTMIDQVAGLDDDRILRGLLVLIRATLRTNYYLRDGTVHGSRTHRAQEPDTRNDGSPRAYLALKLDPTMVPELPEPRPAFEIFVCSPRVEAVHLRFGRVARGGLRWSDRREDFRTEVLGLVKAQAVKNAVIVPVGAKGAFVVKRSPTPTGDPRLDREAVQSEGISCYRMFVSGLLDLTDNLVNGTSRHPDQVVCHDGDDSYLVVAADKGTATFSDIANEVAASYQFWLGDAFASGGSAGYDHKAMGITARGVWESVKRHFRELGIDPQTENVTVVGIGDMSGDVFGNGMLCSEHIRLLAAFDHRHVFVDPDPDPARSYAERRRLFELPRSSWDDYDRSLISAGGGVWPRTAKRIPVGPEMRRALGITGGVNGGITEGITELSPPELIRAILLCPAQLLFNGGIGTYVKASAETHADVGDKANDAVRVDGAQLRVRVVAEGGNLGLTQRGRVEFARAAGLLNTDAIDNSAGVDCSDHEVNIKILLDRLVADGVLSAADRRELLVEMTDEVAALVLAHNADQNTQLGVSRAHAEPMVSVHGRLVTYLEQRHGLDRRLAAIPTRAQWEAHEFAGEGLTSPELSTLMAHVKLGLTDEVLAGELPDAEVFRARLPEYFPAPLRDRFPGAIREHPLRREITTRLLVNDVVDRGGITYAYRLAEELSAAAPDAVRAYAVASAVFDLPTTWQAIAGLGTALPVPVAETGTAMMLELRRLLDRASRWLLLNRPQPLAVAAEINRFRPIVQVLAPRVPGWLAGGEADNVAAAAGRLTAQGVPDELALQVGAGLSTFGLLDVVEVTELARQDAEQVAPLYYALSAHLDIDRMLSSVNELERGDRWHALARLALRDDLYAALRDITLEALHTGDVGGDTGDAGIDPGTTIEWWEQANSSRLSRARAILGEISDAGSLDLATLSVAVRALTRL